MTLAVGVSAQGLNNFSTSATTAPGVATQATSSTFIVGVTCNHAIATPFVNDNMGNTYVQVVSAVFNSSTKFAYVYACENGVGGAGHTWTATQAGGSTSIGVFAQEITGTGGFATADVSNFTSNLSGNASTPSITTTAAGDAVLSFVLGTSGSDGVTISDSTGLNAITQSQGNGSTNGTIGAVAATIQGGAGAISDTYTFGTGGTAWAGVTASWKFSGGGGGGGTPLLGQACL